MLNDHVARCVAVNPRRFAGLGTLPMQSPELACQELRRCVRELGLVGVEIGTHINGWTLDRPELFPIFALAEELGASVFVHPWDMIGGDLMKKYWLSWLVAMPAETSLAICSMVFGGVLERCVFDGGGHWDTDRCSMPQSWETPAFAARPLTSQEASAHGALFTLPPRWRCHALPRLPRLRVCFAHGGGSFPGTIGRVQHGFDVRPDLCGGGYRAFPCRL